MQLFRLPSIASAALAALAALSALPGAHAAAVEIFDVSSAAPSKTATTLPCTASATSGAFYDLRPDMVLPLDDSAKKPKSGVQPTDYAARGHDYGSNFTLNICAAVVSPVKNVMGVDRDLWANVSAYYEHNVLQYTGGSPCPDPGSSASTKRDSSVSATATTRRKSATFAFLCDRDPLETTAHVSFVGTPDQCAYFFKIRSPHACAIAEPHKPGSVGPGGVFVIIFGVALTVYFVGGIVYNRTVAHARGWRQLPNHTIWLGIWTFVRDSFIILTSSCARLVPQQQGYRSLSASPSSRNREDENRLIDQLDEEWDE